MDWLPRGTVAGRAGRLTSSAAAVLCLLAMGFQALGVGHWWGGHEIVTPDEAAEHASHCHGDTSSCGGGGVAVVDAALAGLQTLLGGCQASSRIACSNDRPFGDAYAEVPDEPPRDDMPPVL